MLGRRAGDAALLEAPNAKLTVDYLDVDAAGEGGGDVGDPLVRQELARLYTYAQPVCGTPSGARPRRSVVAVRRWPASASSPRPAS